MCNLHFFNAGQIIKIRDESTTVCHFAPYLPVAQETVALMFCNLETATDIRNFDMFHAVLASNVYIIFRLTLVIVV